MGLGTFEDVHSQFLSEIAAKVDAQLKLPILEATWEFASQWTNLGQTTNFKAMKT